MFFMPVSCDFVFTFFGIDLCFPYTLRRAQEKGMLAVCKYIYELTAIAAACTESIKPSMHYFVCMNTQILTIIQARDPKFGLKVATIHKQVLIISNHSCHAYQPYKSLIYEFV